MRVYGSMYLVAACLVDNAFGHYVFSKLVVNGTTSQDWEYIRNVTEGWLAHLWDGPVAQYNPSYDLYDENVRCGRGAAASGSGVKTATVLAGDEVGFSIGPYGDDTSEPIISHDGPGQAYLSRVPDGQTIEEYRGEGDWFKIGYIGARDETHWELVGSDAMTFKIPETTPPGGYLMRAEHIFPNSSVYNDTQLYINCAHVNIIGPGGGTPSPLVKFPGAYDNFDVGLWNPFDITSDPPLDISDYIPPGPALWTG